MGCGPLRKFGRSVLHDHVHKVQPGSTRLLKDLIHPTDANELVPTRNNGLSTPRDINSVATAAVNARGEVRHVGLAGSRVIADFKSRSTPNSYVSHCLESLEPWMLRAGLPVPPLSVHMKHGAGR